MAQFRKAIEIKPTMSKLTQLGAALVQAGKLDEGIVQLRESWRSAPTMPRPATTWGMPCSEKGTLDEPLRNSGRSWRSIPSPPGSTSTSGVRWPGREVDEAIEHCRRLPTATPDLPRPNMSWVTASTCGEYPGGAGPLAQRSPVGAG